MSGRPEPWAEPPEGFHFEPHSPAGWITPPCGAGRCRFGAGPGRPACGKPAAASLMRTIYARPGNPQQPWDYCADHLYGGWLEDGQVMRWRLVRNESDV